jgi:hypothetical protein
VPGVLEAVRPLLLHRDGCNGGSGVSAWSVHEAAAATTPQTAGGRLGRFGAESSTARVTWCGRCGLAGQSKLCSASGQACVDVVVSSRRYTCLLKAGAVSLTHSSVMCKQVWHQRVPG